MKAYLTIADIANELQVTTRTIRNYLHQGKLKGEKINGRWRFSNKNLHELIALVSIGNQGMDAIEDFLKNTNKPVFESLTIIDMPIQNETCSEFYRDKILQRYNEVYSGKGRKLHYEIISREKIRIIISGPIAYVQNFGNFIYELVQYKSLRSYIS